MRISGIWTRSRRRTLAGTAGAGFLVLALASTAFAGLVNGSLPGASLTFTSTSTNAVNITGNGIHLKTKGPVDVKTTYSKVAPTGALLGWHYHHGPVIVTVTVGTLTFVDDECETSDLGAGQTYIESTGEVLNAYVDATKNAGLDAVEWFTTRLYPAGSGDSVPAPAPCQP